MRSCKYAVLLYCFRVIYSFGLQIEDWNINNLEIHDWEIAFPSPFPTPFEAHPRYSISPTISIQPTSSPTSAPTFEPTFDPSIQPSLSPSLTPTLTPSIGSPTTEPSHSPSNYPTLSPSFKPSPYPTLFPSLPGHIGSQAPTPHPTSPHDSLQLEYVLFGSVVTLGDMMIIAATIWSAIIVMIVAFFHRLIIFVWNVTLLRQKILRPKSTQIIIDPDSSMHSEISENSRTPLENNPNMELESPSVIHHLGKRENKSISNNATYTSDPSRLLPTGPHLPFQPSSHEDDEEILSMRLPSNYLRT